MVEIEYFGGNAVKITSNKQVAVVDPKRFHFGLKDLDAKQAIEMVTANDLAVNDSDAILLVDGPGEYEVHGYSIKGIAANAYQDMDKNCKNNNIYSIEVDDVKIAILGNIEAKLSEAQLEEIGVVDILILPVGGGGFTLYGKEAAKIIKQIEPKIAVPIHFAGDGLNYEVAQDTDDEFTGELGATVEKMDKLVIKKITDLPENLQVIKLTRR